MYQQRSVQLELRSLIDTVLSQCSTMMMVLLYLDR